jgi:hypothetical protein
VPGRPCGAFPNSSQSLISHLTPSSLTVPSPFSTGSFPPLVLRCCMFLDTLWFVPQHYLFCNTQSFLCNSPLHISYHTRKAAPASRLSTSGSSTPVRLFSSLSCIRLSHTSTIPVCCQPVLDSYPIPCLAVISHSNASSVGPAAEPCRAAINTTSYTSFITSTPYLRDTTLSSYLL